MPDTHTPDTHTPDPHMPGTHVPGAAGEHPNVSLLKDGYTAFAKGDMTFIRDLLAENVVHRVPGRGPLCGEYRTPEEVLGFYVRLFELSGGTFRAEPYAVMANEEYGAALVQTYAERPGRPGQVLDGRAVDLFRIEDGKITEIRTLAEDQYADDAFWS
ncbi:nuclear transport factor 2 family protein [Actinomadura spongiicola]|uniref:Nuclear transport factor 2 family protein n=1 Tax=Actinomadura spongiicola TaxID=2303421 RepID=A0A372GLN0_9ACTN|nr:nuclear transport factor 2 family protein [Actinomadura spongiicola]RFS86294.1 nuclear transport factor 2 family protein [Actinomadura spongiicola]